MGQQFLSSIRRATATIPDALLHGYLENLTYKLAAQSQLQDHRLSFVIIDSEELNAFAAPGGIIGVNTGLFLNAETEAEFASVMAHEIAHVSQRHFARSIDDARANRVPELAALLAGVIVMATSDGQHGAAAIAASQEVVQQMSARAARLWEVQPEDVEFVDGTFICTKNTEDKFSFKELASKLTSTGGLVTCSAMDTQGGVGAQLAGHIVDVEVDPETGKANILRYTTFLDAGKAVYPAYVEGQMQGGALQGIGCALNEEYFITEDGTMANSSLLDYRMPTSLDMPMIDTVIIEVPNPRHPFGLRAVGETVIVPPLGAIANAISHAIGVRMTRLPMTPGAVLEAIVGKKTN